MFFFPAEQDYQYPDSMEVPSPEEPSNMIQFSYHSTAQMINILKKTEERCPQIARTYSVGRSMEGRELLVIEFSNNPGSHELREFSLSKSVWTVRLFMSRERESSELLCDLLQSSPR